MECFHICTWNCTWWDSSNARLIIVIVIIIISFLSFHFFPETYHIQSIYRTSASCSTWAQVVMSIKFYKCISIVCISSLQTFFFFVSRCSINRLNSKQCCPFIIFCLFVWFWERVPDRWLKRIEVHIISWFALHCSLSRKTLWIKFWKSYDLFSWSCNLLVKHHDIDIIFFEMNFLHIKSMGGLEKRGGAKMRNIMVIHCFNFIQNFDDHQWVEWINRIFVNYHTIHACARKHPKYRSIGGIFVFNFTDRFDLSPLRCMYLMFHTLKCESSL